MRQTGTATPGGVERRSAALGGLLALALCVLPAAATASEPRPEPGSAEARDAQYERAQQKWAQQAREQAPPQHVVSNVVRYRRADGSVGFAADRASVPAGAEILATPTEVTGSVSKPPVDADGSPIPLPRRPQPPIVRSPHPPAENPPENWRDPSQREADLLKSRAENLRSWARSQRPSRTGEPDSIERKYARRRAEIEASELERQREVILDRCRKCEDD